MQEIASHFEIIGFSKKQIFQFQNMRQEDESHDGSLTSPFVPSDTNGCDVQANTPDFAEEESKNEQLVSSLKRTNKIITEAKYGILHFVKHSHSLMLTDC